MKYYIILIGLAIFTLSSCEDMLDVPSKTELSSGSFFQTQADFEKAVAGIYEPMRGFYQIGGNGGSGNLLMAEMHSDNARYSYNSNFRATIAQEDIADFIYDASSGAITARYRTNYLMIGRANEVLSRIDEMDFDQAVKDNLKGQSLFMRALRYFDLVQYYGEIPLHLEPSTSFDDVALPLSSVDEVYNQIIADATAAASLLPSKANQDPGRASSDAANTLLGNVYIVREQWSDAETVLKKVAGSLLPNYADVFNPANKGNSELIFEAQYSQSPSQYSGSFMYWMWPQPISGEEITAIYEDNGLTPPASIQGRDQGGVNVPSPDLIAAYEDGDLRKDATVGMGLANGKMTPYAKKYLQPCDNFLYEDLNFPIYRYAEVLLMLAEATHKQGNDGAALNYINQVRARAGLAALTSLSDADIMHERRVEFGLEGKRWLDLVRTNSVQSVISAYGERIRANPQDYYFPFGVQLRQTAFQDFSDIFPKPAAEALLSPYF